MKIYFAGSIRGGRDDKVLSAMIGGSLLVKNIEYATLEHAKIAIDSFLKTL